MTDTLDKQFADLPAKIVDNILLMRLANGGIAIIRERTLKGEFLDGSSPNAGEYSTVEMPLPLARLQRTVQSRLTKEELKNKDAYRIFTSKKGNVWIAIKGGYKQYRALAGKQNDHVVMSWSGRMLRNLGVIRTGEATAEVGFKNAENTQLATWHNLMGAGRGKRKHVFMGFTARELETLAKIAGEEIALKLQKL